MYHKSWVDVLRQHKGQDMKTAAVGTAILSGFFLASMALAQDDQSMMSKSMAGDELTEHVDLTMCHEDGIGLGGYDPVSYRQDNGPVKGSSEFVVEHEGTRYLFSSEANAEAFGERPDYYLPAYAGFCAITLALGRVTCPEYTNFKIENDQLLLFEVTGFTNGRTLWNSDASNFRQQADNNYDLFIRSQ